MNCLMDYHNPVLLQEAVGGLAIKPDGVYVDVTYGGGGHSREILNQLDVKGRLYGFDQDQDAQDNIINDERFTLIPQNFRHIRRFLRFYNVTQVDGILGDFGVSSHQFDVAERGFSTRFDGKLDMRMNQMDLKSAYTIVNEYEEGDLRQLFWSYGELRMAPKLARAIVSRRKERVIETSEQLKEILIPFLPKRKEFKILAQIYQAIRIEVNQEIDVLKEFLQQTTQLLDTGGRLSLISYHSLEDRLVKRFIRNGLFEGEQKIGKLIVPQEEELSQNNRARSAKLRIAERL